ncbi:MULTISPECIES: SpoIIE family protein phosphatase [unclassified Streptomyces]|uniref:SpoIIE family protein phosphatase n=1 Tax=unclassified Streptomyces TaxID=2593676 RepID=UPI002253D59E|nr:MULTISPECIES: SpoIIE family protein phosphatase [unclassified Streptomyces]MCX4524170.1 SpoIIE family protein phosphatase [Streptomyces sp. NBC_01551]MCX4545311.1 SpoIIE family protein phosphatase [Streptomyces sp. NBC_01565]
MTGHGFAFCGAELAAVYVVADQGRELHLAELTGNRGVLYGLPAILAVAGHSPAANAYRSGRPLWLTPQELATFIEDDPHHFPTRVRDGDPDPPARISLGALPLGHRDQELGCLIVAGQAGDGFSADDRSLLELYADQVAAGLESVAARWAGHKAPAPQAHLGQSLVPDHGGAFIVELSTGRMEAHAHVLELLGLPPEQFDGQVETLLACAVPDDMPALMAIVEPDRLAAAGQQLAFRIRRPNGELRWLGLRCRVEVDSDGRPRRVLGVVADATYLRPSADEVSLVQRLSATLAGAATIREVSRLAVAALREPLGASRVAVGELEPERLIVTALDPPEPDAWPEVWRSEWRSEWPDAPLADLPTLQSALRGGHMSLWPPGADLEPGLLGVGPGGLAVLPLPADGRMVGVCLVGWDTEHRFGPEERSLLTATAGLVGQALVRAHALDAGHELATMLQRSLLPRKLPELPGGVAVARYLPATAGLEVGGDWYDVIPLRDGHVAFVIGDVQGHSAGAATIMGQMRTAVRAYAVEGHPPDVVVARANRLLVGMETDLFATCGYVDLDMEEGIARVVRAGHLPPVLRHPDGVAEEMVVEGGPPLGVLAEAEFPMTEVGLVPGTVLVLLTDGLVESARLPMEEGMRRVCGVLAAANPVDAGGVADELVVSGGRRDDDVALLLLRYDGTGGRPMRSHWTVWRLPNAVLHARRFTARTLRSWGVEEELDAALLVVSELVTNAIAHTQGEVGMDLTLSADRLRIAVNDASPRSPVKPVWVSWESTGGRGLLIVDATTTAWGSVPLSGGKQVWAEIPLAPSGDRPPQ